ncbi:hypothetical protein GQ53DRAFT_875200 [Thozetella sp. PMI_491]|nr:hypothetical protein GQ53DRAFT_875200 [Thozetella sp. PMI_491]
MRHLDLRLLLVSWQFWQICSVNAQDAPPKPRAPKATMAEMIPRQAQSETCSPEASWFIGWALQYFSATTYCFTCVPGRSVITSSSYGYCWNTDNSYPAILPTGCSSGTILLPGTVVACATEDYNGTAASDKRCCVNHERSVISNVADHIVDQHGSTNKFSVFYC